MSILPGNCMETLDGIPDGSVQCVVTSPPYFGLRDYGTAIWEGGEEDCDHSVRRWEGEKQHQGSQSGKSGELDRLNRKKCRCGAIRKDSQIGLEETPEEYVQNMVLLFGKIRRILAKDGTVWLNLGDSYYSSAGGQSETSTTGNRKANEKLGRRSLPKSPVFKPKDLIGIPWRVALALQADGWYLRQDIIWAKPNPTPESVKDRCTKSHEYMFLLTKNERYFYDSEAIKEPSVSDHLPGNASHKGTDKYLSGDEKLRTKSGLVRYASNLSLPQGKHSVTPEQSGGRRLTEAVARARQNGNGHDNPFGLQRNKRSVWTVTTKPFREAHYAVYPPDLIEPCILAGTSEAGHCPSCSKRWTRMQEKRKNGRDWRNSEIVPSGLVGQKNLDGGNKRGRDKSSLNDTSEWETIGWQASCRCGLYPVPDVVLDPFGGSGTTAGVSLYYGRNVLLCELSKVNIEMTGRRISWVRDFFLKRERKIQPMETERKKRTESGKKQPMEQTEPFRKMPGKLFSETY